MFIHSLFLYSVFININLWFYSYDLYLKKCVSQNTSIITNLQHFKKNNVRRTFYLFKEIQRELKNIQRNIHTPISSKTINICSMQYIQRRDTTWHVAKITANRINI